MIKFSRGAKICSIISIFLIILSLVLLRPINKKLESVVQDYAKQLNSVLYEKAGISISYKFFSPSILSSFKISDIECVNKDGQNVVKVENLVVKYKLFHVIFGNYSDILKSVKIDGANVDLSKILDIVFEILDKQKVIDAKEIDTALELASSAEFVLDFEPIAAFIPSNCVIKNLVLIYNNDYIDSTYFVDEVSLSSSKAKKIIDTKLKGRMELLVKGVNINVDGNVLVNATLNHNLENSTAKITATNFDVYGYKIKKQTLLASYKNYELEAHSIQSVSPFYLLLSYNFRQMNAKLGVKTQNLAPMSVFSTKDKALEDMIKDFRLTLQASLEYNIETEALSYASDGSVYVPKKIISDGLNVNYDLTGDFNHINVSKLNVNGSLCDIKSNFNFIYKDLKLDGLFDVQRFTLPNKTRVSAKVYIDPLSSGFTLFSPQVHLGSKTLTALQAKLIPQKDSIDFDLEVSDYAIISGLSENNEPLMGKIEVDGSYILSSNYAQANVSLSSLSISSMLSYAQNILSEQYALSLDSIKDFSSPYLFSGDVYVSSDLKSISYNVPYVIVANAKEDNQYIFASANGNEQTVQLNRFDVIFGGFAANLTGLLDITPNTNDIFFDAELIAASIPYHFSGTLEKNKLSISGDYGINAVVDFANNKIKGSLATLALPFNALEKSFNFTIDTNFEYDKNVGPQVQISNLTLEQYDYTSSVSPKISLSGTGTKYGAQLTSIVYSDKYSVLDGSAEVKVNINDGIFNSASILLNVMNDTTKENILLDINASNPELVELNSETLLKNIYFNINAQIHNFEMSRFSSVKNSNNRLSTSLSLTGTLEHPYATVSVSDLTLFFGNTLFTLKGDVLLEDRLVSIVNTSLDSDFIGFTKLNGQLDLEQFNGEVNTNFFIGGNEKLLQFPLKLKLYDSYYNEESLIPQVFTVTLSTGDISGSLIKKKTKFDLTLNYSQDFVSLFSSDNLGLVGTYIPQSGEIFGSVDSTGIFSFDIGGIISLKTLNADISRLKVDLKQALSYVNFDKYFKIENAMLEGQINVSGSLDEPDFNGLVSIISPKFRIPLVFDQPLSTQKINITATGNEISLEQFNCSVKNSPRFTADAKLVLDKWAIDTILCNVKTLNKQVIPIRFNNSMTKFFADITSDLQLLYERNIWNVTGSLFADDVDFSFNIAGLATSAVDKNEKEDAQSKNEKEEQDSNFSLRTNLKLRFGTHVSVNFKPLLRAIFAPNTNMTLVMDTDAGKYEIDGQLRLRSGDIAYLQRNFYIKEGSIKVNSNDLTNPVITLRAETREKDANGQQVKIILSVENQNLKNLDPKFSSVPSRSEKEIMALLGQVMKTDSENISDVLLTVGDYYIQSTVMSGLENKLRDLLNFDIFSIRTNFLQNTFGSINSQSSNSVSDNLNGSQKQTITIGNFLDNSTVYIGKYLSSALYVDGMLHLSTENEDSTDITSAGNLTLKPEIGLELELPIANIRWSMSPDINALMNNQYVPSTALTLSWKFNF